MSRLALAPVNVISPSTAEPDWANDLTVAALTDPRRVVVFARPGQRRPRTADLAADLLDALGRPGVAIAVRKNLSSDLTRVVPFLLTDDITDLIVMRPEELGREACEDLIAVAMLAHIRLWLVLGSEPTNDLADLLTGYAPLRWSAQEATRSWVTPASPSRAPRRGAAGALGRQLALNQVSSDEARDQLARTAALDPCDASRLADMHGRDTLRPALRALVDLPDLDTDRLRRVTIAAVAPRATTVRIHDNTVTVPPSRRRALLRQRLHALVIGQRPAEPMFTVDGTPMTNATLAGLVRVRPGASADQRTDRTGPRPGGLDEP